MSFVSGYGVGYSHNGGTVVLSNHDRGGGHRGTQEEAMQLQVGRLLFGHALWLHDGAPAVVGAVGSRHGNGTAPFLPPFGPTHPRAVLSLGVSVWRWQSPGGGHGPGQCGISPPVWWCGLGRERLSVVLGLPLRVTTRRARLQVAEGGDLRRKALLPVVGVGKGNVGGPPRPHHAEPVERIAIL